LQREYHLWNSRELHTRCKDFMENRCSSGRTRSIRRCTQKFCAYDSPQPTPRQ